jgi:hypothetical protein
MAAVNPDDDSIHRWVVWHYRYDPERNERRNVVVAAFDNEDEFHADLRQRASQLRERKQRRDVDPRETVGGMAYEPGYRSRQDNARLWTRAIEHGVTPTGLADMDFPSNVVVARAHRAD